MALLSVSCAKQELQSPDSARDLIPDVYLEEVEKPLASGITREDLLRWGLEQSRTIDDINCILYELRRLNTTGPFVEPKPAYCVDELGSPNLPNTKKD